MPSSYAVIKAKRESDPEYAQRMRDYAKKYREANREKEQVRQRKVKAVKRESDRDAYNEYMRKWREANADSINAKMRERRLNDPEFIAKVRESDIKRYWKDPEKHKDVRLRGVYGITIDDYNELKVSQDYKCAICSKHENSTDRGLNVDHCHTKGHVRGLLCNNCNNGLGRFKDSIDLLQKAIDYLKERG